MNVKQVSFLLGLMMFFVLPAVPSIGAEQESLLRQLHQQVQAMSQRLESQEKQIGRQNLELSNLRQQVGNDWLNEQRREQVIELVHEVLADADTRASLLENTMSAGWNNGFFLASEDGNFYLRIMGQLQMRYTHSVQDDASSKSPADFSDNSRGGFDASRNYFGFKGHVGDPTWQYFFWAGYKSDGSALLLDVWVNKKLGNGWNVVLGQFKLPFMLEYLRSTTRFQFVERSLLVAEFCGSYTQGLMLVYQDDDFHGRVSFNDGASRLNSQWNTQDTEYAFTARGEYKPFGNWKDYNDWQGFRGQDPLLVLGGAVHVQKDEYGTSTAITAVATDDHEALNFRWTADASWEWSGGNLFLAVVGSHTDGLVPRDELGVVVQAGVFATEKLEFVGRYEWSDPDAGASEQNLSVLTMGFNYFIHGHQLRLTSDIGYALSPITNTFDSASKGYRIDAAGKDGQIVIRSQLQLLF